MSASDSIFTLTLMVLTGIVVLVGIAFGFYFLMIRWLLREMR